MISFPRRAVCTVALAVFCAGCATDSGGATGDDTPAAETERTKQPEQQPEGDTGQVPSEVVEACRKVTFPAPETPKDARIPCDDDSRAAQWASELRLHWVAEDQNRITREIYDDAPDGFELRGIGPARVVAHDNLEELRSFAEDHVEEGYEVGYRYVPALRDEDAAERHDPAASFWHTVIFETHPAMSLAGRVEAADAVLGEALDTPFVEVRLTAEAKGRFEAVSKRGVGRNLAVVHEDFVIMAPKIMEPIPGGALYVMPPWGPARDLNAHEHSVVVSRK